jgi:hypothetical protein
MGATLIMLCDRSQGDRVAVFSAGTDVT